MSGHPTFNQEKLTKRAKRQVGFVLQVCTADLCQSLLCEVLQALLCPPPPPPSGGSRSTDSPRPGANMLAHLGLCIERHGCLQDDLLYETLTVYETLYYAAMLRLPSTMTTEQKMDRVNHVIHTLGLDKCKDTIVGRHQPHSSLYLVVLLYTQDSPPEGGCTRDREACRDLRLLLQCF